MTFTNWIWALNIITWPYLIGCELWSTPEIQLFWVAKYSYYAVIVLSTMANCVCITLAWCSTCVPQDGCPTSGPPFKTRSLWCEGELQSLMQTVMERELHCTALPMTCKYGSQPLSRALARNEASCSHDSSKPHPPLQCVLRCLSSVNGYVVM